MQLLIKACIVNQEGGLKSIFDLIHLEVKRKFMDSNYTGVCREGYCFCTQG